MNHLQLPSQQRLRELLNYDPDTGVFTWKAPKSNRIKVGQKAGAALKHVDYRQIGIDGTTYRAHRLAWMYVYGEDPGPLQVDHINRDRSDNRIGNLRLTTNQENHFNLPCKGCYFRGDRQQWCAQITFDGVSQHLGYFMTEVEARLAYLAAKKRLHPI